MNPFLMQAALGALSGVAAAAATQTKLAEASSREQQDGTMRSPGSKPERPPPATKSE